MVRAARGLVAWVVGAALLAPAAPPAARAQWVPDPPAPAAQPAPTPTPAPPAPAAQPAPAPTPEPAPAAQPAPPPYPPPAPYPPAYAPAAYPPGTYVVGGPYPPPVWVTRRGVPALWVTGLSLFLVAYLVPPIVAAATENATHGLEIPLAGWIVFLAQASCPDRPEDPGRESACTLGIVGAVWAGVLQLAGAGLFIGGLVAARRVRVMVAARERPELTVTPLLVPGGAGLALSL